MPRGGVRTSVKVRRLHPRLRCLQHLPSSQTPDNESLVTQYSTVQYSTVQYWLHRTLTVRQSRGNLGCFVAVMVPGSQ